MSAGLAAEVAELRSQVAELRSRLEAMGEKVVTKRLEAERIDIGGDDGPHISLSASDVMAEIHVSAESNDDFASALSLFAERSDNGDDATLLIRSDDANRVRLGLDDHGQGVVTARNLEAGYTLTVGQMPDPRVIISSEHGEGYCGILAYAKDDTVGFILDAALPDHPCRGAEAERVAYASLTTFGPENEAHPDGNYVRIGSAVTTW